MMHRRFSPALQTAVIAVFATSFAACAGPGNSPLSGSQVFGTQPRTSVQRYTVGLGPVVTSQFGGQIFGWDIDQNGNDGVLAETVLGSQVTNAIETFNESTGKITKVIQKRQRLNANVEPVVDAIAGSDVGIVDVAREERPAVRTQRLLRPDQPRDARENHRTLEAAPDSRDRSELLHEQSGLIESNNDGSVPGQTGR